GRGAGRAVLTRLLRGVLVFAAVYGLRPALACGEAAPLEHCRLCGRAGGSRTSRVAESFAVAERADHSEGGLGVCPRFADELVREPRRGLCLWIGSEQAPGEAAQYGDAGSRARGAADGQAGSGVSRLPILDAGQLEPSAASHR